MQCRAGCGACCIAASITGPIPGMPQGKPAGVRCVQLDEHSNCLIFTSSERPNACAQFKPEWDVCGDNREQALQFLADLEKATSK